MRVRINIPKRNNLVKRGISLLLAASMVVGQGNVSFLSPAYAEETTAEEAAAESPVSETAPTSAPEPAKEPAPAPKEEKPAPQPAPEPEKPAPAQEPKQEETAPAKESPAPAAQETAPQAEQTEAQSGQPASDTTVSAAGQEGTGETSGTEKAEDASDADGASAAEHANEESDAAQEASEGTQTQESESEAPVYRTTFPVYNDGFVTAKVTADEKAKLPEDAVFHADYIGKDSAGYSELVAKLRTDLQLAEDAEADFIPFDLYFTAEIEDKEGKKTEQRVEPEGGGEVSVEVTFAAPLDLGVHETAVDGDRVALGHEINGRFSKVANKDFTIRYVVSENAAQSIEEGSGETPESSSAGYASGGSKDAQNAQENSEKEQSDAEPTTRYQVRVQGLSFRTQSFSRFSAVLPYAAKEQKARQMRKAPALSGANLLGAEGDSGTTDSAEDPEDLSALQLLTPMLYEFSIDDLVPSSDNKYHVKSGKKYTVRLGFMENPDGTGPANQFGTGTMYYPLPDGITIPNPVTEDNKGKIHLTLEKSHPTTGADYPITASYWIKEGRFYVAWDFSEDETTRKEQIAALENCYNTFFELELTGIIRDNVETINWGGDVGVKEFEIDTERELDVSKSAGAFDSLTDSVHYTITVTSTGVNDEVTVKDSIPEGSQNFLKFSDGSKIKVTIKDSKGEVISVSENVTPSSGITETAFTHVIDQLDDGQKAIIEYDVKLTNMDQLTGANNGNADPSVAIGISSETKNEVRVTSKQVAETELKFAEVTLDGKIKTDGISKSSRNENNNTLNWTMSFTSRPEDALNAGGRTITDSIANQNTEELTSKTRYAGNGIRIKVYKASEKTGTAIADWTVSWTDLNVSDASRAWSYVLPQEANGNPVSHRATGAEGNAYYYEITYQTQTDTDEFVENKTIVNTGSGFGSGQGKGTVGPEQKELFDLRKEVADRTRETQNEEGTTTPGTVTWKITMDIPSKGLEQESVLTDTLPTDGTNWDSTAGTLESAVSVDGLLEGESYKASLSEDGHQVILHFYKGRDESGNLIPGFLPSGSQTIRKVTVLLKTESSSNWATASDGTKTHENKAKFENINVTTREAFAKVVSNPYFKKEMELHGNTKDGLPIVKSTITLYGSFANGSTPAFEISDTFDERLAYLTAEEAQEAGGIQAYLNPQNGTVTGKADNENHSVNFRFDGFTNKEGVDTYTLTYYLKIKDKDTLNQIVTDAVAAPGNKVALGNQVSSTMFGENEATVDFVYTPATKEWLNSGKLSKRNRTAKFRIEINKESMDLDPDSDWLMVPDQYDAALSVDYNSIQIQEFSASNTLLRTITYTTNSSSSGNSYWDGSGNSIIYWIPDGRHVVITYEANVSGWGEVSASNTVTVRGYSVKRDVTADFGEKDRAGGSAYFINLKKYKDGDMTAPLGDVTFNVYRVPGNTLANVPKGTEQDKEENYITKITTGPDGMALINGLRRNTYYYLVEQTDSAIYYKDPTRYTFRISADGSTDYSTYTYKKGDILTVRNETKLMDIPVTKVWHGGEPAEGTEVTFTLYEQHWNSETRSYGEKTQVQIGKDDGSNETAQITITKDENGKWTGAFTNIPRRDENGNTILYTVEETPVEGYISDGGKRVDDSRDNRVDKGFLFTNIKEENGTLKLSKNVLQQKKRGETFTVEVTPAAGASVNLSTVSVTGAVKSALSTEKITLQLRHGDTVIISNLPYAAYNVKEINEDGSDYTAASVTYQVDNSTDAATTAADIEFADKEEKKAHTVTITNDFSEHPEQKLIIRKDVIGGPASAYTKEFKVRIKETTTNQYLTANGDLADVSVTAENAHQFTVSEAKQLEVSVPVNQESEPSYKFLVEEVLNGAGEAANDLVQIDGYNFVSSVVKVVAENKTLQEQTTDGKEVAAWSDQTVVVQNTYTPHTGFLKITKNIVELGLSDASGENTKAAKSTLAIDDKVFYVVIKNYEDQYLQGSEVSAPTDGTDGASTFTYNITGLSDEEFAFKVSKNKQLILNNVPIGENEYTVIELDNGRDDVEHFDFVSVEEPGVLTVKKDTQTEASLTNTYKHKLAKLSVTKAVSVRKKNWFNDTDKTRYENILKEGVKNQQFIFDIYDENKTEVVESLEITGTSTKVSSWLPVGTYWIKERSAFDGGNDYAYHSVLFTEVDADASGVEDGFYRVTLTDDLAGDKVSQTKNVKADNRYDKVRTYITLNGKKLFENGNLSQKAFAFTVKKSGENTVVATGNSNADGTITFTPKIGFRTEGTYSFTITEDRPGSASQDGYDTKISDATDSEAIKYYTDNGIKYDPRTIEVTATVVRENNQGEEIDDLKVESVTYKRGTNVLNNSSDELFENKATITKIQKLAEDQSKLLSGASYKLTRTDGDKTINVENATELTWTTGENEANNPYLIYGLKDGTYKLEETTAPTGYYVSTVTFKVAKGKIAVTSSNPDDRPKAIVAQDNGSEVTSAGTIQILKTVDYPTSLSIKKVDNETGSLLEGAVLQLYKADDFGSGTAPADSATPIKEWTSGAGNGTKVTIESNPDVTFTQNENGEVVFQHLPANAEYVLYEKSVPNNRYKAFAPFRFKLNADNTITKVSTIAAVKTWSDKKTVNEITLSGEADSDAGMQITAADTYIRGHFTIDKTILQNADRTNALEKRTPSITDKNGTKSQNEVSLDKSGATFKLYFKTAEGTDDILIAEGLTTGSDGKWTSWNNSSKSFKDPYDTSRTTTFDKGLPVGTYYLQETAASADMVCDATAKAAKYEFTIEDGTAQGHNSRQTSTVNDLLFHANIELTKLDADANNAPIPDAVFTLTGPGDTTKINLTGTTGTDGKITFSNLSKGTYTLKETENTGYDDAGVRNQDSKFFEATITIGEEHQDQTITVAKAYADAHTRVIAKAQGDWDDNGILNYHTLGTLSLKKVDGSTPLNGVKFKLQKKVTSEEGTSSYQDVEGFTELQTGKVYYASETTGTLNKKPGDIDAGNAGELIVKNLPWGDTYRLVEVEGLSGYYSTDLQGNTIATQELSVGRTSLSLHAGNIQNNKTGLMIQKTSSGTQKTPLKDAVFTLKGEHWDAAKKEISSADLVLHTGSDGKITEDLTGVLLVGRSYELMETRSPKGYQRPGENKLTFTMGADGKITQTGSVGAYELTQRTASAPNTIILRDDPIRIAIKKADAVVTALSGAVFEVTPYGSGSTFADGSTNAIRIQTGVSGYDTILDAKLCCGMQYAVRETQAPYGYTRHNDSKTGSEGAFQPLFLLSVDENGNVSVIESGEGIIATDDRNGTTLAYTPGTGNTANTTNVAEVTVKDTKLPEVIFIKKDATSGDNRTIAGAVFTLTPEAGKTFSDPSLRSLEMVSASDGTLQAVKSRDAETKAVTYYTAQELAALLRAGDVYTLAEKAQTESLYYTNATVSFRIENDGKLAITNVSKLTTDASRAAASMDADGLVMTILNDRKPSKVKLVKVDQTETTKKIADVAFSLWIADRSAQGGYRKLSNPDSEPDGDGLYVTDSNGTLEIDGLGWGSYKLVEEKADGYILPAEEAERTIAFGIGADEEERNLRSGSATEYRYSKDTETDPSIVSWDLGTVTNRKNRLEMQKKDASGEHALTGAEFALYSLPYTEGDAAFAVTSGEDSAVRLLAAKESDASVFTIEGIPSGSYMLKETKAPAGYILDAAAFYFEMKTDGTIASISKIGEETVLNNSHVELAASGQLLDTIIFKDQPIAITLEKKDGDARVGESETLADVKFTLTETKNGAESSSTAQTAYTSENGTISFGPQITESRTDYFVVEYGKTYVLREAAEEGHNALTGYNLLNKATITVQSDGTLLLGATNIQRAEDATGENASAALSTDRKTITVTNRRQTGSVSIQKIDPELQGNDQSLAGAKFGLFYENVPGKTAESMAAEQTTNASGQATFANLEWGTYTLKEIEAPDGYELDDTPYEITISASALTYAFTDAAQKEHAALRNRKNVLEIRKKGAAKDTDLEEGLTATFTLQHLSEATWVEDRTLSGAQVYSLRGLLADTLYSLTETVSPKGYQLPEAEQNHTLYFKIGQKGQILAPLTSAGAAGGSAPYYDISGKQGDGSAITENEIVMVDKPITVTLKKTDEAGAALA